MEVVRQKRKYHAKVLSSDAIWLNYLRSIDVEDLFFEFMYDTVPYYNYLMLMQAILFDIPPIEIEPLPLEFNVELPSLEEFQQGILIKLEPINIPVEFPEDYEWMKDVGKAIQQNISEESYVYVDISGKPHVIKPPYEAIQSTRPLKAIFDVSPYDRSYYDPPVVREFLRATLQKFFNMRTSIEAFVRDVKVTAEQLRIAPGIRDMIIVRMLLHHFIRYEAFVLGYSVLGKSKLGKPGSELAEVTTLDANLKPITVKASALEHSPTAMILGLTPLGWGVLGGAKSILKFDMLKRVYTLAGWLDRKLARIKSRFRYTALAFANYQRAEERIHWFKSERADQWYMLQCIRYQIENIVDNVLERLEPNPLKRRLYKSAVLQLLSLKFKRHRWGLAMFKAMSDEELRQWWIEHWTKQGLNPNVLSQIWERLWHILKEVGWVKYQLGQRLKQARKALAQWLK